MAALTSPGASVTIIDQSQYTSTQAGTVPFVLIATEQDKLTPSDTLANGTTLANTEKIITVTSQRDLINLFGSPSFELDASGNPVHDSQLNEYGLLAAYSALGVTNTLYVQRANVNLAELNGTSTRPTGTPADGTYWLDTSTNGTNFGVYEWALETGFSLQTPTVITDTTNLTSGVPSDSFGAIGDYAVVATSSANPIYYKGYDNSWALVGSDEWKAYVPTVIGGVAEPTVDAGARIAINGNIVIAGSTSLASVVTAINSASIHGVTARANTTGQLEIFATSETLLFSNAAGNVFGTIDTVTASPDTLAITIGTKYGTLDFASNVGILDTEVATVSDGGNVYTYSGPTVQFSGYTAPPAWRASDVTPRPTGSIWLKTTGTGNGASWGIKQYDANLDSFTLLSAPLYSSDSVAIRGLDPLGGGAGLSAGAIYIKYDTLADGTTTFTPYIKDVSGILTITGTVVGGSATYTAGNSFRLDVSVPGSSTPATATVTLSGTTSSSLVADILSAGLYHCWF
jgi:hypothetical protein